MEIRLPGTNDNNPLYQFSTDTGYRCELTSIWHDGESRHIVSWRNGGTMPVTESLLARHHAYSAEVRAQGGLAAKGTQKVAVVACMDSRLDVFAALGLTPGDAHVIRNAGGIVTEDTIRSLAISQRLLGTEEIILIHHTDCGMLSFTDDELCRALEEETGVRPAWAPGSFTDLAGSVRQSIARIKASPFVPRTDAVRGFVLDLATGRLAEVDDARA